MAHIQLQDAQAWLESTKMNLQTLDVNLENQISSEVLGRISDTYNDPTFGVPTWTSYANTPQLVKTAIAMIYAGWAYDRQYSEQVIGAGVPAARGGGVGGAGTYGSILRDNAELLIQGIISSSILLAEIQPNQPAVAPVFYPTDSSSTHDARRTNSDRDDTSLGPSLFGVSKVF